MEFEEEGECILSRIDHHCHSLLSIHPLAANNSPFHQLADPSIAKIGDMGFDRILQRRDPALVEAGVAHRGADDAARAGGGAVGIHAAHRGGGDGGGIVEISVEQGQHLKHIFWIAPQKGKCPQAA